MSLTNRNGDDLETYYLGNPPRQSPCDNSTRTKWWKLSPYNCRETINYFLKMLVLPGLVAGIIVLLMILTTGDIENFTLWVIITVLTYTGSIFISLYSRERYFTWFHRIQDESSLVIPNPLNEINETKYRIGFVGDIMMMRGYQLRFSNEVIKFFGDVNEGVKLIVGNLEGIIRNEDPSLTKQAHPSTILRQLSHLLRDNSLLLCLSNNHSIDYGNQEFHKSLLIIQQTPKIDVFGRNDVPNVFVDNQKINISSASEWSNQKNWKCISKYGTNQLSSYYAQDRFNILTPHWNYENERYVRKRLQKRSKKLVIDNGNKNWDLIFGHHTHVRQPIIKVRENFLDANGNPILDANNNPKGLWKLVAFSGGNLTSGVTFIRRKKHIHGRIMRCDIGPLTQDPTRLAIGRVEIQNTFNENGRDADNGAKIKTIRFGEGEQGISRFWMLIIGIAIISIVIILRVLGIF
ncbi:MAG: CapA family protein [Candidatus Lokiarchaeota archaeon]|nr:CapA family protein [Candidatus Lokiarchaeota archaeon]